MRAAQSKGIVDLLVLWPAWCEYYDGDRSGNEPVSVRRHQRPWLVQVKYSVKGKPGSISPADRAELKALAWAAGACPVFARQGPNGRGIEFINLYTKEPIGI